MAELEWDKQTRTVSIDFDRVLHPVTKGYTGHRPEDEPPAPGAEEFLRKLLDAGFHVVISSCRAQSAEGMDGIVQWLRKYDLSQYVYDVTGEKASAIAYVDDRAVTFFNGNWDVCFAQVCWHAAHPDARADEIPGTAAPTLPESIARAIQTIQDTFAKKNADYADKSSWRSNFDQVAKQMCFKDGVDSADTLIAVKQARLQALRANGTSPKNESLIDTYLDRMVYAVIAYALVLDAQGT